MSVADFWQSRLIDIKNVIRGAFKKEEERNRSNWEVMRYQTVNLLNLHLKQEDRFRNVLDLFAFPDEIERYRERKRAEREAAKEVFKKMDKIPVHGRVDRNDKG
jgi:hypothetical protein